VVLLGDGFAQLVDAVVDVLWLDLREASSAEGKVALQDAPVVLDRAGLVLLLADGEEEVYRLIPGNGVRPELPERALRQEALGDLSRISKRDKRIPSDCDKQPVYPELHHKTLSAALRNAAAEVPERVVEVGALPLLRDRELAQGDIGEPHGVGVRCAVSLALASGEGGSGLVFHGVECRERALKVK